MAATLQAAYIDLMEEITTLDGCRAHQDTTQSVSHNKDTLITLDAEIFDDNEMHDNVTDNERITIKRAGRYLIRGQIRWGTNSTGGRSTSLRLNGATTLVLDSEGPLGRSVVAAETIENLVVGDYVEMIGVQTSGAALSTMAGRASTFLSVQRAK